MKRLFIYALAAMSIAACTTEKPMESKIDLANLDQTVAPGADFYQYATGGWNKSHPLTDEYARYDGIIGDMRDIHEACPDNKILSQFYELYKILEEKLRFYKFTQRGIYA